MGRGRGNCPPVTTLLLAPLVCEMASSTHQLAGRLFIAPRRTRRSIRSRRRALCQLPRESSASSDHVQVCCRAGPVRYTTAKSDSICVELT